MREDDDSTEANWTKQSPLALPEESPCDENRPGGSTRSPQDQCTSGKSLDCQVDELAPVLLIDEGGGPSSLNESSRYDIGSVLAASTFSVANSGFVDWRGSLPSFQGSYPIARLDLTSPGLIVYNNVYLSGLRDLGIRTPPGNEQPSVTWVPLGYDDWAWVIGFSHSFSEEVKGLPWAVVHRSEVTTHLPAPMSSSDSIDDWGPPLDYGPDACFAGWNRAAGSVVATTAAGHEAILFSATTDVGSTVGGLCTTRVDFQRDLAVALSLDVGGSFGNARVVNTDAQSGSIFEHDMTLARDGASVWIVWRSESKHTAWVRQIAVVDGALAFLTDPQRVRVAVYDPTTADIFFPDPSFAAIRAARITDGDLVFDALALVFAVPPPPLCTEYAPSSGGSSLGATVTWYFSYSVDGGASWTPAEVVFSDIDWPVCVAQGGSAYDDSRTRGADRPQPAFAYDDAAGFFYVALSRSRGGDRTNGAEIVVLRRSNRVDDRWTEAFVSPVNTITYGGRPRNNDAFSPSLAAGNRHVAVCWHDTWESTAEYVAGSTFHSLLVSVFGAVNDDLGEGSWQVSRLSNPRVYRTAAPHEGPTGAYKGPLAPAPTEYVPWNGLQGRWWLRDSIAMNFDRNTFFAAWGGDQRLIDPALFVDLEADWSGIWGTLFRAS